MKGDKCVSLHTCEFKRSFGVDECKICSCSVSQLCAF